MSVFGRVTRHLYRRLAELPRDESGQSALFAVLTMMLIVTVIAYEHNVGVTVTTRIRLQDAADAAAYSGAAVEANALSSIAWLNSCETYLHSRLQEHMLDVVVYTTASAICRWGEYVKWYSQNNSEHRDVYKTCILPNFLPLPEVGGRKERDIYGPFRHLDKDRWRNTIAAGDVSQGHPPPQELDTAFDDTLFSKLEEKYGGSVTNGQDVITYTMTKIYPDAKKWIAERGNNGGTRRGEMWMRQMSLTAAAIAKALPLLVRNEIIETVHANAPPKTMIAIMPEMAPDEIDSGSRKEVIVFDGEPKLAKYDAGNPQAWFLYDYYSTPPSGGNSASWTNEPGDSGERYANRFLAESRRQASRQGFDYAYGGNLPGMKGEYSWFDEYGGRPANQGRNYKKWIMGWNKLDRYWRYPKDDTNDYERGSDKTRSAQGRCPIGYALGKTAGSEMCHGNVDDDYDAADGHWHSSHGHAHSDMCERRWGGLCIGYCSPWCIWQCLIKEIAGKIHHMEYLKHNYVVHTDGYQKDDPESNNTHVYCKVATRNKSGKNQYPDLLPGMRMPKICFACKFKIVTIPPGIPLIFCTCKKCKKGGAKYHKTWGCFFGIIWEYIPIFPPWEILYNTPRPHQPYPGHFWAEADWEARWSGDPFFYHLSWMAEEMPEEDVDLGLPAWMSWLEDLLAPLITKIMEVVGRISNLTKRRTHHMIKVDPLSHGPCPLCGPPKDSGNVSSYHYHWGRDKDDDSRIDVGMTYYDACRGHDYAHGQQNYDPYDLDFDVDDELLGGKGVSSSREEAGRMGSNPLTWWNDNFAADRFVREWSSPRRSNGQPDTNCAPTVVMTEKFMRHGVTVGLWAPHRTQLFKVMFGERSGHVAVATARVGFVERSVDGSGAGAPAQIVTGAGERKPDGGNTFTTWNLDMLWDEFLDFPTRPAGRSSVEGNLYHADWGVKLVSERYGILPNREAHLNASSNRRNRVNTDAAGRRVIFYDEDEAETWFWKYLGATFTYNTIGQRSTWRFRALVLTGSAGDGDAGAWDAYIRDYLASRDRLKGESP